MAKTENKAVTVRIPIESYDYFTQKAEAKGLTIGVYLRMVVLERHINETGK